MGETADKLLKQVLALDTNDRASLAGALIESLDTGVDPDAEVAWDAEIQRRVEQLDSGKAKAVPWSEVRRRLFSGYE